MSRGIAVLVSPAKSQNLPVNLKNRPRYLTVLRRSQAKLCNLFSYPVEAVPLKDQTARSITQAFLEGWVYRGHRVPNILVTDQGKNVDGTVIHELCTELGIQKRHITPHHPESDGTAERHIGFVK